MAKAAHKLTAAPIALGLALAGCAGPVETHTGFFGKTGLPATALVVATPNENPGATSQMARDVVAQELVQQGYTVAERGGATVLVTVAERPATVEVRSAQDAVVSPEKRKRLLQSCVDRTHRLTLVMLAPDGEVSRAWAEERHCKGTLAQSLKPLAQSAIASLAGKQAAGVVLRSGRD
jgi:hypothetical protein